MTVDAPGPTLFRLVRHWARRGAADDIPARRGRLVLACEAVHALEEAGTPATVTAVAREMGVDQSGASRLVGDAVASGHLSLSRAPDDGRRRVASLTADGAVLLGEAHRWQEQVFADLTAGWSERRRRDLALALADLMERTSAGEAGPTARRA